MKRKRVPEVLLERDLRRWATLPANIRDALMAGTEAAARLRKSIAATAKVREMPLVRVHDVIWMNPERTATVEGCAGFLQVAGDDCPTAHLSATVAVCGSDPAIRGVLVHEFAHCFEHLTRVVLHSDSGETSHFLPAPEDVFSDEAHDRSLLVEPSEWFGKADADGFFRWGEPQLRNIHEKMIELAAPQQILRHASMETTQRYAPDTALDRDHEAHGAVAERAAKARRVTLRMVRLGPRLTVDEASGLATIQP